MSDLVGFSEDMFSRDGAHLSQIHEGLNNIFSFKNKVLTRPFFFYLKLSSVSKVELYRTCNCTFLTEITHNC